MIYWVFMAPSHPHRPHTQNKPGAIPSISVHIGVSVVLMNKNNIADHRL